MSTDQLVDRILVLIFVGWVLAAAMFSFGLPLSIWSQIGLFLLLSVAGIALIGA